MCYELVEKMRVFPNESRVTTSFLAGNQRDDFLEGSSHYSESPAGVKCARDCLMPQRINRPWPRIVRMKIWHELGINILFRDLVVVACCSDQTYNIPILETFDAI